MKKSYLYIIFIILILALAVYFIFASQIKQYFFRPTEQMGVPGLNLNSNQVKQTKEEDQSDKQEDIQIVAENLQIPWEIVWLPSGEMLVSERPGTLLKFGKNKIAIKIQGVEHVGEGGLQGIAIDPDFATNNYLYLYLTTRKDGALINRVDRYRLQGDLLLNRNTIIDSLPGAQYHDGGRIKFGPDNKLYITIGEASQASKAQDLDFLGGKILRINKDGSIPSDNPFANSPVYSYGHRNPQGIDWDEAGRLWATEHGRSGVLSGYDELNLIEAGKNYGWPDIEGDETKTMMINPVIHSGSNTTWAPAGLLYYKNKLFFAGLRGESLYEYDLNTKELKYHFSQQFGRLRAVALGPDGYFYISTSNTDGRGELKNNDDKIIKIDPAIF